MPSKTRRRAENPVVGKHPDLFQKRTDAVFGGDPLDTDVVEGDWRLATADDLKRAVADNVLAGEDLDEVIEEIEAYEAQAKKDGNIDALLADGMSEALAVEVAADLADDLKEINQEGRERRVAPFIEYIRSHAQWQLEYNWHEGNDGFNNNFDSFENDLVRDIGFGTLKKAALAVLDGPYLHRDGKVTEEGKQALLDIEAALAPAGGTLEQGVEAFEEMLRDPGIYKAERREGHQGRIVGQVWGHKIGTVEDQCEGTKYDKQLNAMVHGGTWLDGNGVDHVYPGLDQEDLDYAIDILGNNDPYVTFGYGRKEFKLKDLDKSFNLIISAYDDDYFVVYMDVNELLTRLVDAGVPGYEYPDLPEEAPAVPEAEYPAEPEIAYVYAGSNEFVAGASAKGMYVAKLFPPQLKAESTALGHCIGNEQHGHPQALRDGKTRVYSIRTEAGKAKFTIELKKQLKPGLSAGQDSDTEWVIGEVKGKGNRLPGFDDYNATKGFTKPDDVRLVTDFLLHLGFSPAAIAAASDMAPGVAAMKETGKDPFKPPVVRKKTGSESPTPNPALSARVARLLKRTHPMGAFHG